MPASSCINTVKMYKNLLHSPWKKKNFSCIYIFQILKLLAASSDESICQVKDLIGSIGHCYPDLHSLYFYPDSQYILAHTVSHTLIYMYYQWLISAW